MLELFRLNRTSRLGSAGATLTRPDPTRPDPRGLTRSVKSPMCFSFILLLGALQGDNNVEKNAITAPATRKEEARGAGAGQQESPDLNEASNVVVTPNLDHRPYQV